MNQIGLINSIRELVELEIIDKVRAYDLVDDICMKYGDIVKSKPVQKKSKEPAIKKKGTVGKGTKWTPNEDNILKDNIDKTSEELAKLIFRTPSAIANRKNILGFKKSTTRAGKPVKDKDIKAIEEMSELSKELHERGVNEAHTEN